jgi:tetratricopeptide (TPR) repeat protein
VKPSFAILLSFSIVSAGQTSAQTSPSFDQLSQQAQQAYESNHEDEAARLYAKAVELRPNWAEGWWAIGMINYETDHYTECRDALTRMTALDATAVPGWALLGLCEFRTRQYELSFQHLKKAHMMVSVKDPDNQLLDMANYHLAMLLTREGAFEAAQEVLVRVALRVKNNPEMMFASGVTSLRMPMLPADVPEDQHDVVNMAGKAFWDLALESSDQAEADFKALVAKYPKFPNAHYFYGTFLGARHPEQSAPQFLAELQVDPDSVPARVQLALRYIIESKTDLALKYAKESVALSPKSVGAQLALGEALRAKGDDEHALAAYLAAEKLEPDSPKIRLFLTNAYRALGRVDDMRREQAEYRRLKGEQQNWP